MVEIVIQKIVSVTALVVAADNLWAEFGRIRARTFLRPQRQGRPRQLLRCPRIAPGPFASEMNRAARDHGDVIAARTPLRRIGRDEDMAGTAIFLASRAGDYVCGDTIAVDGGIAYASMMAGPA